MNQNHEQEVCRAIGKVIKKKLKEKHWSQARLAMETFVSERTVQRWVSGECKFSVPDVAAIADGLGIDCWEVYREAEASLYFLFWELEKRNRPAQEEIPVRGG